MTGQKPLSGDPPSSDASMSAGHNSCPPCEQSFGAAVVGLLELLIDRLIPPRQICMLAMAITVLYLAPEAMVRWLKVLTRLKIAWQRWQLGYEAQDLLVPVPGQHPRQR